MKCPTCSGNGYTERDRSDEVRGTRTVVLYCSACGGDGEARCSCGAKATRTLPDGDVACGHCCRAGEA